MFILNLSISINWRALSSFTTKYGQLFSSGKVEEINFQFEFKNGVDVLYSPKESAYRVIVDLNNAGISSSTTLNPETKKGVMSLEPRTSVNLSDENAEITNPQFEQLAIGHMRMLLTVLKQLESNSLTKGLDRL